MTTFVMPYVSPRYLNIKPIFSDSEQSPNFLSPSLEHYLSVQKDQIDSCQKEWDIYKKYTNPYEWIHSPYNGTPPVSTVRPISRSYFKMVEIINSFDLLLLFPMPKMRSFHLAEGPGGFIEALLQLRYNPQDEYIGMTLLSDNHAVPGWRKSQAFLERHVSVKIEKGEDGTGDIMSYQNVLGCANKYGASMDFVTADGGFDFSHDFNHQETQMSSLMLCQVVMATAVQAKGGTFVLKMFDITSKISVQIMYWLSVMYDRVSVIKPYTSRYANSERYVVCQGFRSADGRKEWTVLFMNEFEKFQTHNTLEFIQDEIPQFYLSRVEECNAILGQQQMNTIAATLNLIRNPRQDKIEKLRMANIQKCVNWCQRNKMGFNRDVRQLNMFLSAKSKVSRVPRREEDVESIAEGPEAVEEQSQDENLDSKPEDASTLASE